VTLLTRKQIGISSGTRLVAAQMRDHWEMIVLGVLLVIGLVYRTYGISFGLPAVSHEEHFILSYVWAMQENNTLNPGALSWPSLLFYIYLGALKLLSLFNLNEWNTYVLVCRWIMAVFGTLTIPVVYLIGRELYSKHVGILAASFVSLLPTSIIFSHIARPVALVPLLFSLTFLFSIHMMKKDGLRYYILATVCAGLATSAKYNGAFAVLLPLAAHIILCDKNNTGIFKLKEMAILIGMPLVAFLITTPYTILDIELFKEGVLFQGGKAAISSWAMVPATFNYLALEMGWVMVAIGILAVSYVIYRHRRLDLLNLSALVVSFGIISIWTPSRRMLFPAMVILAPFLAVLVEKAYQIIVKYSSKWLGIAASIIILVSMLYYPMDLNGRRMTEFLKGSVSVPVFQWLEENALPGSRIYWGYSAPSPYQTDGGEMIYYTKGDRSPLLTYDYDYGAFDADDWDFVILTESHRTALNYPDAFSEANDFYNQLYLQSDFTTFEWRFGEGTTYSAPFSQWITSLYEKRRVIYVFKLYDDDTIKVYSAADATVNARAKLDNAGGQGDLYVRTPPAAGELRTLLKFRPGDYCDPADITAAVLRLFVYETDGGTLQVLRFPGEWQEDTVNWDQVYSYWDKAEVIAEAELGNPREYIEIDISQAIIQQTDAENEECSLALRIVNEETPDVRFETRLMSKETRFFEWRPSLLLTLADSAILPERLPTEPVTVAPTDNQTAPSEPEVQDIGPVDWNWVSYQLDKPQRQIIDFSYDYPTTSQFVSYQGQARILVYPKPYKGRYNFTTPTHLFQMADINDSSYLTALAATDLVAAGEHINNAAALSVDALSAEAAGVEDLNAAARAAVAGRIRPARPRRQ